MATETYFAGDTIKVTATFRDYAEPPAEGSIIDPDTVEVSTYDADLALVESVDVGEIVEESTGVYSYEWVLPDIDGTYYIEFIGTTGDKPTVVRHKVKVKWKPVSE